MVNKTFAAVDIYTICCNSVITIFLFLLFSMCHCAVNWCDKLRFFAFIILMSSVMWLLGVCPACDGEGSWQDIEGRWRDNDFRSVGIESSEGSQHCSATRYPHVRVVFCKLYLLSSDTVYMYTTSCRIDLWTFHRFVSSPSDVSPSEVSPLVLGF